MHRNNFTKYCTEVKLTKYAVWEPLFCLFLGPIQNFQRESGASYAYLVIKACLHHTFHLPSSSSGSVGSQRSSASKCASPPIPSPGKKAWASTDPSPSKGYPSPCGPFRKDTRMSADLVPWISTKLSAEASLQIPKARRSWARTIGMSDEGLSLLTLKKGIQIIARTQHSFFF